LSQGEREPQQGRKPVDASLQRHDLLPKSWLGAVRPVQMHHLGRGRTEPPARRRWRDPVIRRDTDVAGALDELS